MPVITVSRARLLPALAAALKAVERRSTIPVLQNVLLEAAGGTLTVTATDLDIEVSCPLPCDGAALAATLPAGTLHDTVRKLPEDADIRLAFDDKGADISCGRTKFRLHALPAADFPRLSAGAPSHSFAIDGDALDRMISTVSFAISTEETRYYLNGIYLHAHDGERTNGASLVAVATDGHRLAQLALPLPDGAAGMPGIILPRKTVALVKALFSGEGDVAVGLNDAKISFSRPQGDGAPTMTSKLIDGTYPDYRRVVPQGNANRFTLEREELARAVDRVITISGDKSRATKMSFADGALKLAAKNPDSGSAEDEIAARLVEGDAVEVGFNGRYCLDMLAVADGKRIEAKLGDAGAPAVFLPLDGAQPAPLFVLMPMRV